MTKMSAKLPSYKPKTSTISSPETKRIRKDKHSSQNLYKKQTFDIPVMKTKKNTMKRSKTEPTLHRRELKPLHKMPRQSVPTKLLSIRRGEVIWLRHKSRSTYIYIFTHIHITSIIHI